MIPEYLGPEERRRRAAAQQAEPAVAPTPAAAASERARAAMRLADESAAQAGAPPVQKDPGLVRLDVKRRRRPGTERTLGDILSSVAGTPGVSSPGPLTAPAGRGASYRL